MLETWKGFAVVTEMKGNGLSSFIQSPYGDVIVCAVVCGVLRFPVYTRVVCAQQGLAFGLTPLSCGVCAQFNRYGYTSNGGLGPWNIAVMFGLAIYGVSTADGTAFSMLQWSGQTVMLIILGIFTMAYIS